jgi:high-affinity nickel-transport protein
MPGGIATLFDDRDVGLARKVVSIFGVLIIANVAAWVWALLAFRDYPVLIGTAFLAYTFGLRHAVDADHIAAIDNVTRKLMQEGKRPVAIGLFFSLGHSSIVVLASAAIAFATVALERHFAAFKLVGGVIGTLVSVVFLFLVAAANFIILCSVYRTFQRVRRGAAYAEEGVDHVLAQRGFLGQLFRPMFRFVARSFHMYRSEFCLASVSIPQPKSGCSAFPPPKLRGDCRSGRSWCFPRCSRRPCRSSTRRTAF